MTQAQAQCAALIIPELLEEGRLKVREQQHALTARAGARRAPEAVNVRLAIGEADLQDERDTGVVDACGAGWVAGWEQGGYGWGEGLKAGE